jgi:hypothetical protein
MGEPKRHHYVPQFYLENFTDPDTCGLLWVRSSSDRSGVWRRRGPRAVAYEIDFYARTNVEGEKDNELEKALSHLESFFAGTLSTVLRSDELSAQDRTTFALFVANMLVRVPITRQMANEKLDTLMLERSQRVRQGFLDNPESLDTYVREQGAQSGSHHSAEQLLHYLDPEQYRIGVTEATAMNAAFQLVPAYALALLGMDWLFMESDTAQDANYFITSDCPVTVIRPRDVFSTNQGLWNPDLEISLPLSRNRAFLAWRQVAGVRYGHVQADNVTAINARTAMFGKRFLIAPKADFAGREQVLKVWENIRPKTIT